MSCPAVVETSVRAAVAQAKAPRSGGGGTDFVDEKNEFKERKLGLTVVKIGGATGLAQTF
jgi:hypothetical protein